MPLQLAPNFLKITYGTCARALIQFGRNLRDGRVWCLIIGHILSPGAVAAPRGPPAPSSII
jgi:hypothetical protein